MEVIGGFDPHPVHQIMRGGSLIGKILVSKTKVPRSWLGPHAKLLDSLWRAEAASVAESL